MLLRIDPRLTVTWHTPFELQFGAPTPIARVLVPEPWELRVVELLRLGIEAERLWDLAARVSAVQARARAELVLASVERALDGKGRRVSALPSVALQGEPELLERCSTLLAALGVRQDPSADVVVIAEHFLVRPDRYQPLLASDRRHIALLCDDDQVRLSPLLIPGTTACVFCLELAQRDRAPGWPILASQLLRRRAAASGTLLLAQAAIELAQLLTDMATGANHSGEMAIFRADGVIRQPLLPHPDCGCCFLPGNVTVLARREHPPQPNSLPARVALG